MAKIQSCIAEREKEGVGDNGDFSVETPSYQDTIVLLLSCLVLSSLDHLPHLLDIGLLIGY